MRVVIIASALAVAAFAVDVELKWDNGNRSYVVNTEGSAAYGFGNDFDVATLKTSHVAVRRFRIYTADVWPNGQWDGMYLELIDFPGVPGVRIWPSSGSEAFFKPSGTGWGWYDYSLDFPLARKKIHSFSKALFSLAGTGPSYGRY